MSMIYHYLIAACWAVFIIVWIVSAVGAKKTERPNKSGALIRVAFGLIILLVLSNQSVRVWLNAINIVPTNSWINIFAVIICAAGIGFAVWARLYLGRNWGMPMSIKKDADLVTNGPYAYVRHPIYTGTMLAFIGSTLVVGTAWLGLFVFVFGYFLYSAKREEGIMTTKFPNEYPAYKQRTKMIIPFVI